MRMLGRRDALAEIQMKLAEQKFVTMVGPGGIGKTTVAVAVAHENEPHFQRPDLFRRPERSGRCFARRASNSGSTRHAGTNKQRRTSLDRSSAGEANTHHSRLLRTLYRWASAVAEELIRRVPTLHCSRPAGRRCELKVNISMNSARSNALRKIATSRRRTSLQYPSVQLLVDRVRAVRGDFELTDADAPIAARIAGGLRNSVGDRTRRRQS